MGDRDQTQKGEQVKKLFILSLLATISWGGFYFVNKQKNIPQARQDKPLSSPQASQEPTSLVPGEIPMEQGRNTITNDEVGISLQYPNYFKYGIAASRTNALIQIASYDLDLYYDELPKGLKVEITRQENPENLPLLEYAATSSEAVGPEISFKKVKYGDYEGYGRYVQENEIASLEVFLPKGRDVIVIYVIGDASEYLKNVESLEEMFASIRFV